MSKEAIAQKSAQTVKASATVKSPAQGQAKTAEPKKQVEELESRNMILSRRIKHAAELQAKLNLRELFEDSLDDLSECLKEVQENAKDNTLQTSGSSKIQVVDTNGRVVMTFSNIALVIDTMIHVNGKIKDKITSIDNEIVDLDF
jgi:vancomycin resistance protein YoaR